MSLTGADIAEIAKLLDESHFTDLRLEMGSLKLRIRRDGGRWSPALEEEEEPVPLSSSTAPEEAGARIKSGVTVSGSAAGMQR